MELFLLIQNPLIMFNGFVFFFVPLFCESLGFQENITSIFLVLYSETAVLLGNVLPDWVEKKLGGRGIYLAMLLNVTAIAVFAVTRSAVGLAFDLLILGSGASFAKPVQQAMFLRQKPSQLLGEDKAMGIYNFSENIGESLGPMAFGTLMAGPAAGIWGFLALVVGFGGIHFTLNRKEM